jgi:amidase
VYEIHDLGAVELWVSLQRGELGPVEVTRHFLERIEAIEPQVGAFLQVDADAALERARFVEKEVPQTSPLWGIPLADKDLVQRAGTVTTFGSKAFEGVVSQASDEIVRVLDDAGSISLGKTNTPEFGLFGYTENALAEPTRNPYDLETNAGGSSGGAAAAVAARMLPFAPALVSRS